MSFSDVDDSMEESFDEDAYFEKLGTRPVLDTAALGSSYQRMVELFYLCTEEDPKKRPSATQIVQALESNTALERKPCDVIVIDWGVEQMFVEFSEWSRVIVWLQCNASEYEGWGGEIWSIIEM